MSVVFGLGCKLYRNSGSFSSPTWVEVSNVTDVTLSLDTDLADVTTRAASGWKVQLPTLKNGTVSYEMIADPSDANYTAFFNAFLANTFIDIAVASGVISTTGTQYFRALFAFSKFELQQPLADAQRASVEMVPTFSVTQAPGFFTAP